MAYLVWAGNSPWENELAELGNGVFINLLSRELPMTQSQLEAQMYAMQNVVSAIAEVLGPRTLLTPFDRHTEHMRVQFQNTTVTDHSLEDFEAATAMWRAALMVDAGSAS